MCGCNLGFFHPNSTLYTGASPCEPCLPNADCSGSTAPPLCKAPQLWLLEDDNSTGPGGERSYYQKMDPTKKWHGSIDDLPNKGAEVRKKSDNSLVRPGFTGIFIDFSLGKSPLEFKCNKNPAVSSTDLACLSHPDPPRASLSLTIQVPHTQPHPERPFHLHIPLAPLPVLFFFFPFLLPHIYPGLPRCGPFPPRVGN